MTADELAAAYSAIRPRLVGIAYAVLGTRAEAEDVVSDCWLRLAEADAREPVRDVEGWAVVAVSRRALDVLRSARVRRESYVGPWLPEPIVDDLADRVSLDERVSFALMVVLETLTPAERTAWVLHELFGMPFPEIATVVGRSPAAVRQLASRARAHVAAGAPRLDVDAADHRRTVDAFLAAAEGGDLAGLLAVLDPDVVLTSDGAAVPAGGARTVRGAQAVARGARASAMRSRYGRIALVNGAPGLVMAPGGRLVVALAFTFAEDGEGRITGIDVIADPERLAGLDIAVLG